MVAGKRSNHRYSLVQIITDPVRLDDSTTRHSREKERKKH